MTPPGSALVQGTSDGIKRIAYLGHLATLVSGQRLEDWHALQERLVEVLPAVRLGLHETSVGVAVDLPEARLGGGAHRGGSRAVVQQRQLAKVAAGSVTVDRLLGPGGCGCEWSQARDGWRWRRR